MELLPNKKHLADLGLAVSKINHDLRNILASASLFSDRLANLSDPVAQRLAPRLVRAIDRATTYTRSVLAYGKAGEPIPQRSIVNLHRLCEDVAEALALDVDTRTESDVAWVNAVDPGLEVEADPEQLFRALMNLSRNAVQAMENTVDGSIVKRLAISAVMKNEETHIIVADTGPGFPPAAKDDLFTAFSTLRKSGGTGLGLAIAAELIRSHGGSIRLLDDDAPGARFEIVLPNSGRTTQV